LEPGGVTAEPGQERLGPRFRGDEREVERGSARAWSRSACGGLRFVLNGDPVLLRPSGALFVERLRTLVVSDLHFEKGSHYARKGLLLPPYDTDATLARLEAEAEALAPATLVFLGDTFHDDGGEARLAAGNAARIAALASGRTLVWIVGNHDEAGPRALPGDVADTVAAGALTLTHEPEPGRRPGEVAGHLHPCAKVVAYRRSVRSRAFLTDGERLIAPAFGAYAGGLNVLDPAYDGLFAGETKAVALGRDRLHVLSRGVLAPD
jgi:DNA ligase-associated metallophosphoesterase